MEENTETLAHALKQVTLEHANRGRKTMEDLTTESDDDYDKLSTISSEEIDVGGGVSLLAMPQMHKVAERVDHPQPSRPRPSDFSVRADHQIDVSTDGDDASAGSDFEADAESWEDESNDEGFGADTENDLSDNFNAVQEVVKTQSVTPAALQEFMSDDIAQKIKPEIHAQSFPEWFLRKELDWNGSTPRLCCATRSANKEYPSGSNTIVLKREDSRYVPMKPGSNGAILYVLPDTDRLRFENVPIIVELEDSEFGYMGHYSVESEPKASNAAENISKQQVVDAFTANTDAYPVGERLQWIFLRCKTYNHAYVETLRTSYERRKAANDSNATNDAQTGRAKTAYEGPGFYDNEADWGTADMQEAIAASLLTSSSIPSTSTPAGHGVQAEASRAPRKAPQLLQDLQENAHATTHSQTEVSPVDEASKDQWSSWGMPPPHEWRVRWGGVYGHEAPSSNR